MIDLDKIIKYFIIPILILTGLKSYMASKANSPQHIGSGYSVMRPASWEKTKKIAEIGVFANTTDIDSVTFINPNDIPREDMPNASISIFATKLVAPMWIDTLFPEILQAITVDAISIIDKGDMMIDNQPVKWVLYQEKEYPIWNLEFYFTDEKNGLYKIRCSTPREDFKKNRQFCEEVRASFKFSLGIF